MKLEELKATYTQDNDTCDSGTLEQAIEISTQDGGGGIYYTIKTERWAFENTEELQLLISDFVDRLNLPIKI